MVTLETCVSLTAVNHFIRADIINVKVHLPTKSRGFYLKKLFTVKNRRKEKETTTPDSEILTKAYLEDDVTKDCLIEADFLVLVSLPNGIDYSEWLATHTVSFFEHVNVLYGCVSEFCQSGNCSSLTGASSSAYQWIDDKGKKCKCTSACQYIDYVMSFSQKNIHDESVFPTKYGNIFPNSFETTVKKIHRLLLHVLVHIYHCHWQEIVLFKLHSHLNVLFYHFNLFNKQFNLIEDKEMEVLDDLFQRLHHNATRLNNDSQRQQQEEEKEETTSLFHSSDDDVVKMLTREKKKKNENVVSCDSYSVLTLVT